jgi:2-phospho-L-lactate/phosphoenolpyruvate guanylyltransferase
VNATAILPVKRFARAKTRLLGDVIGPPERAALLRAMLTDVLNAIGSSAVIERVVVVTGEGRAERLAMEAAKRITTPIEVLQDPADPGHSEAATLGIVRAKALGAECVALLPGDCPLLDPADVDGALERMEPGTVAVVPDRHGTGTNGLLMAPVDAIGPAFGPDSCERHLDRARRAGWNPVLEQLPSLGLDLDTSADLEALRERLEHEPEAAPATARALGEMF